MRYRLLALMSALVAVIIFSLAAIFVSGQAPTPAARTTSTAKTVVLLTPWGEPDLQGIWTDEHQTPLQRPTAYAGREFLTEAEIAALDKERATTSQRPRVRPGRGSEADVAGAYSGIFLSVKPTGRRTSLIVDPPDGRIPPLTPGARKRADAIREYQLALLQNTETCKNKDRSCAGGEYGPPSPRRAEVPPHYVTVNVNRADGPEDRGLGERCMSAQLPDFGGFRRIAQSPGSVSIFYDVGQGQGWQRIIPVTDRPHLPPHVRQWWGDSRGRWEGNTLVVDITNFSPKAEYQGSRENLHLVERWTRVDANTLEHIVTINDPTTWTRPWTVKIEMARQHEQANRIYYEPRCHEGNYGLVGLLAGARAVEKVFAERRGPNPAALDISSPGTAFFDAADLDPLAR